MASAIPPLGHPWHPNIGHNPNIARDLPPPPLGALPSQAPPTPPPPPFGQTASASANAHITIPSGPIYSPAIPIGIGHPGAFPPSFVPNLGLNLVDAFNGGVQGALAPIRTGRFMPGADGGIGYGIHAGAADVGVPFPPPPPGAMMGNNLLVPPFAPVGPLWSVGGGGGLAWGNMPVGAVPPSTGMMGLGMMGMGLGIGMGGATMHDRPAPALHDGNLGFASQPKQEDPTQIAGGIPAGVTLVESAEHTIFFHIKGNVCPWLSPGAQLQMEAMAIGSSTGLNRLIQVLNNNASAEECQNTAVTECIELGNGLWEKGQTFRYDDAVSKVLTMGDAGWDNKRNRDGGHSLHLWCHQV